MSIQFRHVSIADARVSACFGRPVACAFGLDMSVAFQVSNWLPSEGPWPRVRIGLGACSQLPKVS